jgi:hypothetical protein
MPVLKVIKNGIICNSPRFPHVVNYRYRVTGGIPVSSIFFNTGELIFEIDDFVIDVLCTFCTLL